MKLCSLDARSEVRSGYSSLFGLLDSVLAGCAQWGVSQATRTCYLRLLGEGESRWDETRSSSALGRTSVTGWILATGL